jgi:hypothetical protein
MVDPTVQRAETVGNHSHIDCVWLLVTIGDFVQGSREGRRIKCVGRERRH